MTETNPFARVDRSLSRIKKQQRIGDKITTKKRGRPRKPNMVKKLVKVDAVLYQQIIKRANSEHTSIAAILARAMKRELSII